MQRRTFLTGMGLSTVALAGCLDMDDGGDVSGITVDERCDGYVVVSSLPEPAHEEATAAIEAGTYESERELILPEVIVVDETFLVEEGAEDDVRYYDLEVETDGDQTRLHAEETIPETEPVEVRNRERDELTIDIHLEYDGETLLEETMTFESGEVVSLGEDLEYRYGSYRAEVTIPETGVTDDEEWSVDEFQTQRRINVEGRGIFVGQNVSERVYCEPEVE